MSRTVVVIGFILFLFSGILYGQQEEPKKTCPAEIIENCPDSGCGSWDPEFDRRKNLISDPKSQTPTPMTLEAIRKLEYPKSWSLGKDRAELEKLGEGTYVQVTAYLVGVKYGDLSSANCKLAERWSVNDILILVSTEGGKRNLTPQEAKRDFGQKQAKKIFNQREASSVTAEITPRVRLKHIKDENKKYISNWLKEKLDAYINRSKNRARLVRITGLLLLDTEHIYKPMQRSTDWQINPVLKFEVCERRDPCVADGDWTNLDDIEIRTPKPPPPLPLNRFSPQQ